MASLLKNKLSPGWATFDHIEGLGVLEALATTNFYLFPFSLSDSCLSMIFFAASRRFVFSF
jgi:hypothetical protein